MTLDFSDFIEEARGVSISEAAKALGLRFSGGRGNEHAGPCPACGGRDGFAFNTRKNAWNCRRGGVGGRDAVGMAGHVLGLALPTRTGLLEACAAVLGRPVPNDAKDDASERAARVSRLALLRARHEAQLKLDAEAQGGHRLREEGRARTIYENAQPFGGPLPYGRAYLRRRTTYVPAKTWLRVIERHPYYHGQDEHGRPLVLFRAPAMVAPILNAEGVVVGCHQTWLDLTNGPKFRPVKFDPMTRERMATKKMRGTKRGGIIPVCGDISARRWICAEGIENAIALAGGDGFKPDTFYFAAGDLGNMAGPDDPASRFAHPTARLPMGEGRSRPVRVPGPAPKPGSDGDAMWVPDHVRELFLLADNDSERVFTVAAMARAKARFEGLLRRVYVLWPPKEYADFADMAVGVYSAA